jgi:putative FmdB family regulatory protein
MPVYEYMCTACKHRFAEPRRVSKRSAARCPQCGARARKVFGAVGIIFKGSGFHSTDYRKPEEKKRAAEETAPTAPGAGGGKSGGKPEKATSS